jgi:MFS family permease
MRSPSTSDAPSKVTKEKSKILVDGEELTVQRRIDQIGFGIYQLQVFLFAAGSLWCEGTQLSIISGVKTLVYTEFHITSDLGECVLMTILYIGFACGTGLSGNVGDTKGRRLPILIGYSGIVVSQLLLYFTYQLWLFYCFIFLLGFFAAFAIPAAIAMLTEVMPKDFRGLFGAALCIGFSCGELTSAIGLRFFCPNLSTGPYRDALLFACIPPVFLLVAGLILPVTRFDSPQFLASHNRQKELRGCLNLMATMNGRPELELKSDLPGEDGEADVSFSEVLAILGNGPMGTWTVVLCIMFFTFNYGYYGTVDFWPIGWSGMHLAGVDKATELIYTALIGLCGVPVAVYTMAEINRRDGACFAAVMCAIAAVCLHGLLHDEILLGWVGVIMFKVFWMTFQMTTMNLPNELYTPRVSVGAWAIICFVGRIGSVIVPTIVTYTEAGFLVLLSILLVLSAIAVWWLPETQGVDIEEIEKLAKGEKLAESGGYGSLEPTKDMKAV